MITVCLNRANFEYDIHSLVKAFFATEEVKVFADQDKISRIEQQSPPRFRLEICYRQGKNGQKDCIEVVLQEPEESAVYAIKLRDSIEADFSLRIETKNQLKRCLYQMLSKYTGQQLPWGALTGIRPVKIAMAMLEEGKEEAAVRAHMASSYFASQQKIDLSIEIAKREKELLGTVDYQDGYSLYIGIPFCPSICSYCSFSSSPIEKWKDKVQQYLDALEEELRFTGKLCRRRKLNTIYIGGGTPTTLSPEQLKRLFAAIEKHFDCAQLSEYTVEAGRPDSITRDKLNVLKSHGISRISINPQTMKQETLDIIGRRHTPAQAEEAFFMARELGFDNINMDFIVGLPKENIDDVRATMEAAKKLSPDSLTVHSLAMKRAARFRMVPEDYEGMEMSNSWDIIDLTARYARDMGLAPYYLYRQKNMAGNFENVGYAAPLKAGLYNILMMEEKQPILALGAGSISKQIYPDGHIERCENVKDVAQYIARIDEMIARKKALFAQWRETL